ncbi:MAG: hypothetical protein AB7S44_02175 [Spirochaetales bacterium]
MEVERVYASKRYANKFVKINGQVLTDESAPKTHPELKKQIEIELAKPNSTKNIIMPFKYPSDEQMLSELNAKKLEIYKLFNIKKPKTLDEAIDAAGVLYDYFCQHVSYDQTAQQDRENFPKSIVQRDLERNARINKLNAIIDDLQKGAKKTKLPKDEVVNLLNQSKEAIAALLLIMYKNDLNKMKAQYIDYLKQKEKVDLHNFVNTYNAILRGTYNALIREKDVCFGFTYGYLYLIADLGLELKVLNLGNKNNPKKSIHNVPMWGFKEGDKTTFFIADIMTGALVLKDYERERRLFGFGLDLESFDKMTKQFVIANYADVDMKNFVAPEHSSQEDAELITSQISKQHIGLKTLQRVWQLATKVINSESKEL